MVLLMGGVSGLDSGVLVVVRFCYVVRSVVKKDSRIGRKKVWYLPKWGYVANIQANAQWQPKTAP